MTTSKKGAIIFLWILNILNVLAGFISQFEILLGKDITSIIPINAPLLVNQIVLVNFMALAVTTVLIAVTIPKIAATPLGIKKSGEKFSNISRGEYGISVTR
mgnify:CR=1 FL=1